MKRYNTHHQHQEMANFLPEQLQASFLPAQRQSNFLPTRQPNHILTKQSFSPQQLNDFLLGQKQDYFSQIQEQGNLLPGLRQSYHKMLTNQIISQIKSDGVFDQLRSECLSDGDITPAYRNLNQRVEANVKAFLSTQTFAGNLNKLQLREQLRKNITESGILDANVGRIVDQVVDPKINTVFRPKVQEEVYKFLEKDIAATLTNNSKYHDESRDANMLSAAKINGKKESEETRNYLPNIFDRNKKKIGETRSGSKVCHDKYKLANANNYQKIKVDQRERRAHNNSDNSNNKLKTVLKANDQNKDREMKQYGKTESIKKNDREREKNEDKTRHESREKLNKERSHTTNKSSVKCKESSIKNEDRSGRIKVKKNKGESDKNNSKENEKDHTTELTGKKEYDREKSNSTKHRDGSVSLPKEDKVVSKKKKSSNKNKQCSTKDKDSSNKLTSSSKISKVENEKTDGHSKSDKLKLKKTVNYHNNVQVENKDIRSVEKYSNHGCSEISSSADSGKVEQRTTNGKSEPRSSSATKTKVIKTTEEKTKSRSPYGIETRQSKKKKAAEMANNSKKD
ncbi:unnamed protein product [Ceutorhynchus assimilis]|uniref:BOD1/SHG1 domain-containing protein n=1 Tax=Ceutorhynchus assimilis TaxID=467358 RepID=A0A9P0GRR2_9CUCU|nr:unnamed protein product [Ceutorhynchus assimilis]